MFSVEVIFEYGLLVFVTDSWQTAALWETQPDSSSAQRRLSGRGCKDNLSFNSKAKLEINICEKDPFFVKSCGATLEGAWFSLWPRPPPTQKKIQNQLAEELQNGPLEDDEKELLLLLNTPHLKVWTHSVATKILALLFRCLFYKCWCTSTLRPLVALSFK